jgi:hypothetical protein
MSNPYRPSTANFVRIFNGIARHHHRYEVFRDFVVMSAIELHNWIFKVPHLEAEYIAIAKKYPVHDRMEFPKLFAELVLLLDTEPRDILGQLYMSLELGNNHTGQFFTPPEVSELMAMVNYGDKLKNLDQPFIRVGEPACGAGGMILAFAKVMISCGHNPAERMWAHCQDVDRIAALMCYVQLSLWNIPATVVVGNTLMLEVKEVFHTPAYHLGLWHYRLRRREDEEDSVESMASTAEEACANFVAPPPFSPRQEVASSSKPAVGSAGQFDFGF